MVQDRYSSRVIILGGAPLVDRLDGSGMLQGAGHSLGRGRDANIQRQDVVADGRAALQIHLPLLQHGSAASRLRSASHDAPGKVVLGFDEDTLK